MTDMKRHIHESNLIEGYDDLRADQMGEAAWAWLMTQPVLALNHNIICKLQKRITLFQTDLQPDWRGYYRTIPVWVGRREGVPHTEIKNKMDYLISIFTFTHPRPWHVEFEKVHPFVDGNGRTGRMLMWWMEHHRGEKPTLILNSEKQKYYGWFR